jgi:hypothetical protein
MQDSERSFISIGADLGEPEANSLADLKIHLLAAFRAGYLDTLRRY